MSAPAAAQLLQCLITQVHQIHDRRNSLNLWFDKLGSKLHSFCLLASTVCVLQQCLDMPTTCLHCCRGLCARLTSNLVAPEHLEALLQLAVQEAGSKADQLAFLPASLELLVTCAAAAPILFAHLGPKVSSTASCHRLSALAIAGGCAVETAGYHRNADACIPTWQRLSAKLMPKVSHHNQHFNPQHEGLAMQVAVLLSHKDSKLGVAAAEILTHAASYMAQDVSKDDGEDEEQEEFEQLPLAERLKPLLLQLCSSGPPKAAKVAIRCDHDCGSTFQKQELLNHSPAVSAACIALDSLSLVKPEVPAIQARLLALTWTE